MKDQPLTKNLQTLTQSEKAMLTSVDQRFDYKAVVHSHCQTLSLFKKKVTTLLDQGNAAGIGYLDFGKAFNKVPQNILIGKADKLLFGSCLLVSGSVTG